jgi:hypothetical protein
MPKKRQNTKDKKADMFAQSEGSTANRLMKARKAREKALKETMK